MTATLQGQCASLDGIAPIVCPLCHFSLELNTDPIVCRHCNHRFEWRGGFPDLIFGGRFEDSTTEEKMVYEELSNEDTTRKYWIPLFRRLFPEQRPRRLLSMGCGIGIDVDMLADAGFECVGIDCGNRTEFWRRRRQRSRLLLANGMNLPFADQSFDGVFCGCVFPHVGVVGDTFQVTAQYYTDRLQLACELVRILAPGGRAILSSPNRYFPVDLFHGRPEYSYVPIWHKPWSAFLLSHGDYHKLFDRAGCTTTSLLPVEGYWGFIRSRNNWKGRLLGAPLRHIFKLVSRPGLGWLRGTPINPWIVVMAEKAR